MAACDDVVVILVGSLGENSMVLSNDMLVRCEVAVVCAGVCEDWWWWREYGLAILEAPWGGSAAAEADFFVKS